MLLGVGGATKTYIDDVFSTYVYRGTGSSFSVNNGIDLAGEGGLTWFKYRDESWAHALFDSERGITKGIESHSNSVEYTVTGTALSSYNSDGFSVGSDTSGFIQTNNKTSVSWTFRKAKGFFDIVTWTGNGTANRKISHSLDSVPGAIWIKRLTGSTGTNVSDWICYHRESNGGSYPWNYLDYLNRDIWPSNDASGNYLYNVAPASDEFTIGSHATVNNNGDSYVAYIFAHDDQRFGKDEDEEIIKCGSYTGNGGTSNEINLGWEPQWVLVKNAKVGAGGGSGGNWIQWDNMRGVFTGDDDEYFSLNDSAAESAFEAIEFTPTGFTLKSSSSFTNGNTYPYIFIAIRRSDGYVGKPAEAGTDVFALDTGNGSTTIPTFDSGFPADMSLVRNRYDGSTSNWELGSRLLGSKFVYPNLTNSEATSGKYHWDSNQGVHTSASGEYDSSSFAWMWKRHAGFDVVAVDVTTEGGYPTYNHSLGVVPEMIWSKRRDSTSDWTVYHKGLNGGTNAYNWRVRLNENAAQYEDTYVWGLGEGPSSTQFQTKGASFAIGSHIFLLFASVEGVSKIGYYSGSNSSQTISTGFAPRFLIMKKVDTTQGWVVLDTVRGWGSGDDERLEFHNTSAQNDSIDFGAPTSSGFTLTGNVEKSNQSGGSYIYYAHA